MTMKGCPVKQAEYWLRTFIAEQKYCSVCRRYFHAMLDYIAGIREGKASPSALDVINELTDKVNNLCQCGRGKGLAEKVKEYLQQYKDDFTVHIENRVCPAAECPRLVLAPCQAACPAGLDIPNYVTLVGMGKYADALNVILADVPLPGSLGRICEHPCERACRRSAIDEPVSICTLKRVAYDRAIENGSVTPSPQEKRYGEKIAVIGAGPAGLSAAYFLARQGYGVTIFEAMPEPGGMLAYGIPPYRLPRQVLRDEIDKIKALGVEIKLNTPIAGENGLMKLKEQGYAAVFLGTGAWKGTLPVPNPRKLEGVLDGISFLTSVNRALNRNVNLKEVDLNGKQVLVVGGGNVAIDAARVSLRLGARAVRVVYRRTREEMPALPEEIIDAEKEGVAFDFLVSPTALEGADSRVTHLVCLRNTLSAPDAGGRRKPVPVDDSKFKMEADMIIFATGQQPDLSFLTGDDRAAAISVQKNRIMVNPDTMETSLPGVFAGGDAVTGPASAIKAIAAGKRAAAAIHAYLRGQKPSAGIKYPVKRPSLPPLQTTARQKSSAGQVDVHSLYDKDKQGTFAEIVRCAGDEAASAEAARCLRCDMCTACGNCVNTCQSQVGVQALKLGYVCGSEEAETDFHYPEERCLGCGTCSVNCPTGAITLEDRDGFREMRMCGSLMSRLELVSCRVCERAFATAKHLDFISGQIKDNLRPAYHGKDVCPDCARRAWSHNVFGVRIG
ncbi:FAD-dependent oxidoreductase [Desulfoscipio geothermicus]|uniref:Putative selenate reductase, YgfK subunit n=1 Tax=Desulfoscipio geothermicus DSM 3669 TaxID=1121426 RepID=A0A1I6E851_9FIRM|nr:FAD-dependent oxidoreductase [Desulfoscipio geothermicus]SFR13910.1 putative selenate reductase, YgfK subunit [Desulfoscipio geothermicus DSM 3669]